MAALKEGYASNGGVKVFYRYARRGLPWLVFLHGATGSMSAWFKQEKFFLENGFSLLFIDLRGHGRSDRGQGRSFFRVSNFSADLKAVMAKLGIKKAVVIGHCFGGMVAQDFAFRHPEKIDGLVLISTSGRPVGFFTRMLVRAYLSCLGHVNVKGIESHPDYSKFVGYFDLDPRKIVNDFKYCGTKTYCGVLSEALGFKSPLARNSGRRILLVHGIRDPLVNYRNSIWLGNFLRGSQIKLLKVNHVPLFNSPDELNSVIYAHVKDLA